MLCVLDIDTTNQETAGNAVCTLIELACPGAQLELKQGKAPDLYKSGVRYVKQDPKTCAFKPPSQVYKLMGGDCKQLALWRIAELRNAGINATPRCLWIKEPNGFRAHAVVRLPDGRIEDPSINLGMKAL